MQKKSSNFYLLILYILWCFIRELRPSVGPVPYPHNGVCMCVCISAQGRGVRICICICVCCEQSLSSLF